MMRPRRHPDGHNWPLCDLWDYSDALQRVIDERDERKGRGRSCASCGKRPTLGIHLYRHEPLCPACEEMYLRAAEAAASRVIASYTAAAPEKRCLWKEAWF